MGLTANWDTGTARPLSHRTQLLLVALTCLPLGFLAAYNPQPDRPTVGGTEVPALDCEEDEVITFTGPDTLDCVHFEEVR